MSLYTESLLLEVHLDESAHLRDEMKECETEKDFVIFFQLDEVLAMFNLNTLLEPAIDTY